MVVTSEDDLLKHYKKIFNPQEVMDNLALAALYLATFEILKSIVIGNIRSFFTTEFPHKGEWDPQKIKSKQYIESIGKFYSVSKTGQVNKDEFRACSLWLVDNGVISKEEADELRAIRSERNFVAHELPELLLDPNKNFKVDLLSRAVTLINKIDRWWVVNVDIPTNPDYDGREINEADVFSGRMVYMNQIIRMYLSNYMHEEDIDLQSNEG